VLPQGHAGAGHAPRRRPRAPLRIVETVVEVNDGASAHGRQGDRRPAAARAGKTVAVSGLTFKPNTDDMRDSPSLAILPALQAAGAKVRAFDPEGMEEARKLMPELTYCETAYEAMTGADVLVIITEWNEFRALDLGRMHRLLRKPVLVDLRNIYNPEDMAAAGFEYSCIGRPRRPAGEMR
jgi:UDPglucose 6-dehydrogenase